MPKRNPVDDIVEQWRDGVVDLIAIGDLTRGDADAAVDALLQAGWRLVRTDDCADPAAPIGRCGCTETRITQEWTARDQLREMRGA